VREPCIRELGKKLYSLSLGGLNMESPRFDQLAERVRDNWTQTAWEFRKFVLADAPAMEPLSEACERELTYALEQLSTEEVGGSGVRFALEEFRRRFPKPAPARKTCGEVLRTLMQRTQAPVENMDWERIAKAVLDHHAKSGEP
jgi:hypothetical protein